MTQLKRQKLLCLDRNITNTTLQYAALDISVQGSYISSYFCFLLRVSILTRDSDIANLSICVSVRPSVRPSVCPSVRYVPVSDANGLTYHHSFSTVR